MIARGELCCVSSVAAEVGGCQLLLKRSSYLGMTLLLV